MRTRSSPDAKSLARGSTAASLSGRPSEIAAHRHGWPTKARAKAAIGRYIDDFYNPRRRHSFVGNISPLDFELRFMQQAA